MEKALNNLGVLLLVAACLSCACAQEDDQQSVDRVLDRADQDLNALTSRFIGLSQRINTILEEDATEEETANRLFSKLDEKEGTAGSCKRGFFPCGLGPFGGVQCVRDYLICDGTTDCRSGADESGDVCDAVCTGGQEFNSCGSCPRTCADPNPDCPKICVPRCQCPSHLPLWHNNQCVTQGQCSAPGNYTSSTGNPPTAHFKPKVGGFLPWFCRGGQVWKECGSACTRTCDDQDYFICSVQLKTPQLQCVVGCQCPSMRPIWHEGRCVAHRKCSGQIRTSNRVSLGRAQDITAGLKDPVCTGGREYDSCGSACTPTCADPIYACTLQCVPRCQCPSHLPFWHNNQCVARGQCPAPSTICTGGQQYNDCGSACTPTCADPNPAPCPRHCVPRCQCPRLWRLWHNNQCVTQEQCPALAMAPSPGVGRSSGYDPAYDQLPGDTDLPPDCGSRKIPETSDQAANLFPDSPGKCSGNSNGLPSGGQGHCIVGGHNATHPQGGSHRAWPWIVSLARGTWHTCGGTLVNNQWVVTAAHCFHGSRRSKLTLSNTRIVVGSDYRDYRDADEKNARTATTIIEHPGYNHGDFEDDIALIKLSSPVKKTQNVSNVCVSKSKASYPVGTNCTVAGWGYLAEDVKGKPIQRADMLQEVVVPVYDHATCTGSYNKFFDDNPRRTRVPVTNKMLCAGFKEGGRDSCSGDSGGPLVCKTGDTWELTGIVSWGVGCAQAELPGVYTDVVQYREWIEGVVANN